MGIGVSGWRLARAVSRAGGLGIVSGTALDTILVRRLQDGDRDGTVREALARFPDQDLAARIVSAYHLEGGRELGRPYRNVALKGESPPPALVELLVVAAFVEVSLARIGHEGPVGINFLEKIQTPLLPSFFGAMLAGVDVVTMGAGIPVQVAGILDRLAEGRPVEYRLSLDGGGDLRCRFDPGEFPTLAGAPLVRPFFLPIISSAKLIGILRRRSEGQIDGLIVERQSAGGHNAPPRGGLQLDHDGEPIYGDRDRVDFEALRDSGLPFWLAGSCGSRAELAAALEFGARGVQLGSLFAYCRESGLRDDLKERIRTDCLEGRLKVRTESRVSPSGYPFKVVQLDGSASDDAAYARRRRVCDLGYLREAHRRPDGQVVWRCPGEPVSAWTRKGGAVADTLGRKCLCNCLLAGVGLGQRRDGVEELPIVTSGGDADGLRDFLLAVGPGYGAGEVISWMTAGE